VAAGEMTSPSRWPRTKALSAVLLLVLAACGRGAERAGSSTPVEPSAPSVTASPNEQALAFPTAAFADISEGPVSEEAAAKFQAILNDMAGRAGVSATVMSADGTWSGATGKADGVRDVWVNDQFAIASTIKSVIAAQVMQMVEAGELALDDPVTDHLPPDLDFDTNEATIRQLLGHRSGIPDYDPALFNPALQESHQPIGNESGRRSRCWSWSSPIALLPVMPSTIRTPTICCSDW
jgi:CubicO group peptidase (beta-lactamase class C family)